MERLIIQDFSGGLNTEVSKDLLPDQYSPDTRELLVKVVIEHFYQDIGNSALEGNTTDILVGPVSDDGKIWRAEWFSFGKYIAYVPEPSEFYNANEPEFRASLIFEKVKE